ncbi:MAG TPA: heavy metal-associated domain-containing protein [Euzebyales bacterium]|nr:heavy metal-associated domain-containing protein [Euzebyales bacterium]
MTDRNPTPRCATLVVSIPSLSSRLDVRRISQHVSDVPGVVALAVDLAARTVTVQGNVTVETVRDAVAAAGYAVTPEPA